MKVDLQRMNKIEERIYQIAREDLKLDFNPIEFDIIPPQKMLEIMSYNIPTNISNWKFGRDYERLRTIHENADPGLPYEVVINSNPSRAYLMNSNPFAVQILVMAHVVGHAAFNKMNRNFKHVNENIMEFMYLASERINNYEKNYGIKEVERIVDAGHALQFHSSPFDNETEDEKRKRIFEQNKLKEHSYNKSEFADFGSTTEKKENEVDIALYNQRLWRKILKTNPVEPTEDLLRYIIDNSTVLEDWQKYILEVLREEGRYYHPIIKTKYMNEGFAVYVHEYIMNKLFKEGYLNTEEHAQFNYSNSLVKAMNPGAMNPYLIGSEIWKDIKKRWDRGQYGSDWEDCENSNEKENWDTGEMNGHQKMLDILSTYQDWFFMQSFLTDELVRDLRLYIYVMQEKPDTYDYVITKHKIKEIRELIINSFSHSQIPQIEVINGNYKETGTLLLSHNWSGIDLHRKYTEETMKHIYELWERPVYLKTKTNNKEIMLSIKDNKTNVKIQSLNELVEKGMAGSKWIPFYNKSLYMSNIINT